jgi:TetR/AcrR family transcriptional repressor of nem operon
MRYSAKHKAVTHSRLLKKATEQFRERGVQATGIAKLMGRVGMTHGGFYAHFKNKEDLVTTAMATMFEEGIAHMKEALEGAHDGRSVTAIVNAYLSERHRDDPSRGCLLPVMAAEIARQPKSVREAYTRGFNGQIKNMAKYMPGKNEDERCEHARLLLAGMAGTMTIARAMSDRELSSKTLAQAREFYISSFERKKV